MAGPSPNNIQDTTIAYSVTVDGKPVVDTFPLVSVYVHLEANRIPYAELKYEDGSIPSGSFAISDSQDFVPGAKIKIQAGYGANADKTLFEGVVVRQEVSMDHDASHLTVICKHKAAILSYVKNEGFYKDMSDSDIIQKVIKTASLTSSVTSTSVVHESVFQKLASDWDFILSRAEINGHIVTFNGDKIVVGPPNLSGQSVLRVALGESIISFRAELNSEKQPDSIEAVSWNSSSMSLETGNAQEPSLNAQGNLTPKQLGAKTKQKSLKLVSGAPMPADMLTKWASATLLRTRLAALKGSVTFQGSSLALPDSLIDLEGVGERFSGKAYISAVKHSIENGDWLTTVDFGLDYRPAAELPGFSYQPAAGQIPAIQGLQLAKVSKVDADPTSEFRIQVELMSGGSAAVALWARLSNFYATSSAGAFFLPEIGDEVIVGFIENHPDHPVILGSLYGSKNQAEHTPEATNYTKGITTKAKLKILFDDEKKITTIETPGGNKIKLDDDGKAIEITDLNSNSIKMSASGIDISSPKNISISAKGGITLDATSKLAISSKADVAVEGLNVKNTAQVGFTAKGTATAELSASGQTTVKGAIVMIN